MFDIMERIMISLHVTRNMPIPEANLGPAMFSALAMLSLHLFTNRVVNKGQR